jgi:hypothetical protein
MIIEHSLRSFAAKSNGGGGAPSENLPLTAARLLSMLGGNEQAAVD